MLDSINIKNFRNIKDLQIKTLGQVNLITGKNNTGKSTILEALSLFAAQGDVGLIFQMLSERGENIRQSSDINSSISEINLKALSSLFTNRKIGFSPQDALVIGSIETTLFSEDVSRQQIVSLRFVRFFDEMADDSLDNTSIIRRKRIIVDETLEMFTNDYTLGIEIRAGNNSYILPLDKERPFRFPTRTLGNITTCQFIRTKNIDREINGRLWDHIALSEKETYIIDALRIIEPDVERIAFIEDNRERTAVIKLKNNNTVLPLKSMGDGINRVLTIILALVNADNGFLLLDEFENGLHFSVQEKLWSIVFNLSKLLNIQVFATTHSEDCISGFERVVNSKNSQNDGKLIRLDRVDNVVSQVVFTADELRIATNYSIETR